MQAALNATHPFDLPPRLPVDLEFAARHTGDMQGGVREFRSHKLLRFSEFSEACRDLVEEFQVQLAPAYDFTPRSMSDLRTTSKKSPLPQF